MMQRPELFKRYQRFLFLSVAISVVFFTIAAEKMWLCPLFLIPITIGYFIMPGWLTPRHDPIVAVAMIVTFLFANTATHGDVLMAAGYMLVVYYMMLFYQEVVRKEAYIQLLPLVGLMIICTFLTVELIYLIFFLGAAWLYSYLMFYAFLCRLPLAAAKIEVVQYAPTPATTLRRLGSKTFVYLLVLLMIVVGFILIPRTSWEINIGRHKHSGNEVGFDKNIENRTVSNILLQNNVYLTVQTTVRYAYFKGTICNRYNGRKWESDIMSKYYTPVAAENGQRLFAIVPNAIGKQNSLVKEVYTVVDYQGVPVFFRGLPQLIQFEPHWKMGGSLKMDLVGAMETMQTLKKGISYTVWTKDIPQVAPASPREAKLAETRFLQLPHLSERVKELSARLTQGSASREETIRRIQNHLRNEYPYSLDVNPGNEEWCDYFLFQAQKGYCVHFATAMAVLLRLQQIPARLVGGFYGKMYDERLHQFVLTNQDAHAWVEVYLPNKGWVAFDPTPPQEDYLKGLQFWQHIYYKIRAWWFKNVIGFSYFHQLTIYSFIKELALKLLYAVVYCLPVAALFLLWRWIRRYVAAGKGAGRFAAHQSRRGKNTTDDQDAAEASYRFYQTMIVELRKIGVERQAPETPFEFEQRVARLYPHLGGQIGGLTHHFCAIRFGHEPLSGETEQAIATELSNLKSSVSVMAQEQGVESSK